MKISFVYFDIGGVMLKDFSNTDKWTRVRRDLGITKDMDDDYSQLWNKHTNRLAIDYDIDEFARELRNQLNLSLDDNYSMLDDLISRFDQNLPLWEMAKTLKQSLGVGLLTNMYPRMLPKLIEAELVPRLDWDSIVDSSVVGMEKPNSDIYEYAQDKAGAPVSEILFIDNREENIEAAKNLGWQGFLYDPADYDKSTQELSDFLSCKLEA